MTPNPVHALSVDVEDWNSAALLWTSRRIIPPSDAVVRNTERLLGLMESYGHRATFFVLGEVAERFPDLVKRIAAAGHEIGVHGFHHHRIHWLSHEAFSQSLQRARKLLQDLSGQPVLGHRAVAWSLTPQTIGAVDAILDAGFTYDSSVLPFTRGAHYGFSQTPLQPFYLRAPSGREIQELPLAAVEFAGRRLPCCGGGYLRHFPLAYARLALHEIEAQGRSAIFYLHPYEIDAKAKFEGLPADLDLHTRLRLWKLRPGQWRGRAGMEAKLQNLFSRRGFAPLQEVFHLSAKNAVGINKGNVKHEID